MAGAVTLLNDTVTNTGATLQVDDGITLKLNGTTINGGTINDFSAAGRRQDRRHRSPARSPAPAPPTPTSTATAPAR